MIPAVGETYQLKLYKRVENSPYEYNDAPICIFRGRPAEKVDVKSYRIIKGVQNGDNSTFVVCTNLPKEVEIGDKIAFLGKEWTVESIGYYYSQNSVVNAAIMSDEYLMNRCPKGISLS